jgi:LysR family transcriptional regulator, low CO2-responsive transcriptional regulator
MSEPIDSRQLRAFAALARTASFTQAARELFLSQSAVSHSMRTLEEDVGCRLFDRVGKKVLLTQAGEQFLQHATKILAEMEAARSALKQLGKWGGSRLRLAASTTACQHILPPVLRELRNEFPAVRVSVEPADTPEAMESLHDNRVDLALVLQPNREERLEFHPCMTDEMMFMVSPAHPWVALGRAPRPEIARQQFLLYAKTSFTYRLIEGFFREEQISLNEAMELGSMEAMKELVKLGLGITVLAPWIARREIEEGSLVAVPLGRRKLKREWGILHLSERRLNLAENRFIALCRRTGAQITRAPSLEGGAAAVEHHAGAAD